MVEGFLQFVTIVALCVGVALLIFLYLGTRDRNPKLTTSAPPKPVQLVGPDIPAIKQAIIDVIDQIEGNQASMIGRREKVWSDAQTEVDRLTAEIAKSRITLEAYALTLRELGKEKPLTPIAEPEPIRYPDVDPEKLVEALTIDGAIA